MIFYCYLLKNIKCWVTSRNCQSVCNVIAGQGIDWSGYLVVHACFIGGMHRFIIAQTWENRWFNSDIDRILRKQINHTILLNSNVHSISLLFDNAPFSSLLFCCSCLLFYTHISQFYIIELAIKRHVHDSVSLNFASRINHIVLLKAINPSKAYKWKFIFNK